MKLKARPVGITAEARAEHVQGRQFKAINVFLIIVMAAGSVGYGLSASIISTTLAQPLFFQYMELATKSDPNALIGACVSLYFVGGVFGCIACPVVADVWGRKVAIVAASLATMISGALLCGSINISMFIAFRFFNGVGGFSLLLLIPVLMSEIAPPAVRGAMVVIHGVGIGLGYTLANWIGYAMYHVKNNLAWRIPLLFQCFPLAILLACIVWLPESPRFLIMKDRSEDAAKVLVRLHNADEAAVELSQINRQVSIDRTLDSTWLQMFRKPSYRKRSILGLILASSSQMIGTLVIANYGPSIYAQLGFSVDLQFIFQASSITAGFAASPISILIVDRFPRNLVYAVFQFGCLACVVVEAALSATMLDPPNIPGLRAAVAMIFLFFMLFNAGVDCNLYPYLSEIFPTHIRVKGMALSIIGICLTDILWLELAPTAFARIGWKFYLCFIFPALAMALYILFYAPDTNGVPLEEIAALFGDQAELCHGDRETVSDTKDEHQHRVETVSYSGQA